MRVLNKIHKYCISTFGIGPYLHELYKYKKNQFLDQSALEKLQVKKLNILMRHAYDKVSYYKNIFDRTKIIPDNINSVEDLVNLPIITKRDLQVLSKKEIIARDTVLAKCFNLRTSGSTGVPLDIVIDGQYILLKRVFIMVMCLGNGRTIKDKMLVVTSPQNFLGAKWFYPILYNLKFLREKYVSLNENTDNVLKIISYYQPDIIFGLPSMLIELAWKIKERNIRGISPRMIFLTGETLTMENRIFIGSVFNAEVFDYYSSAECGCIAWECKEHLGYHINSSHLIVEFIKDDGTNAKPDEEGEIVITNLNSFSMPFIRYKLGDIGVLSDEKCPCGRTLPLIKKIIGRSDDFFILSNGKKVYPFYLRQILRYVSGIKQYQMIQQKKDRITINLVKNDSFSSQTIFEIRDNCNRILGNNIASEINIVEEIPRSKTGKFQAIKSELNQHV